MNTTLNEFDIIKQFFTRSVRQTAHFPLSIGDDAALISVPKGYELATSIDTLVEGIHFPIHSNPGDIGYKSLAVSLSDMAAMGVQPIAVLLALTIPQADEKWLSAFSSQFFELAERFNVELIGGNLTRGPLSISTVVYGWAPSNTALRRSGATPGNEIYVTGVLGDAALALQHIQASSTPLTPELHERFFRPIPRVNAGLALRSLATAAIDISDGLAADLTKLLNASAAGGSIQVQRLPLSATMRKLRTHEQAIQLALTGGEDYELCFTTQAGARLKIETIFATLDCSAHYLGTVTATPGLNITDTDGNLLNVLNTGYQHFS